MLRKVNQMISYQVTIIVIASFSLSVFIISCAIKFIIPRLQRRELEASMHEEDVTVHGTPSTAV